MGVKYCLADAMRYQSNKTKYKTKQVTTIVPVQSKMLGIKILGTQVTGLTDKVDASIKAAGINGKIGARITAIEGTTVASAGDIDDALAAAKTRPMHIRFEWTERVVASFNVKIVSDGEICKNIAARFIRHKFRWAHRGLPLKAPASSSASAIGEF